MASKRLRPATKPFRARLLCNFPSEVGEPLVKKPLELFLAYCPGVIDALQCFSIRGSERGRTRLAVQGRIRTPEINTRGRDHRADGPGNGLLQLVIGISTAGSLRISFDLLDGRSNHAVQEQSAYTTIVA